MTDDKLIRARWDGEVFRIIGNSSAAWCHENLKPGDTVGLDVIHERSGKSHRHQFAEIRELWHSLPDSMADLPYAGSPETLRKHALMACGYYDAETIDAGSTAAAERVAAMAKRFATAAHGYCIVKVKGPVVRVFTPQSQSYRAMGGDTFKESKAAVLEWISAKIEEEHLNAQDT